VLFKGIAVGFNRSMKSRPAWLKCLILCVLLGATAERAAAQTYPDHPVRIVVPFAAGGPADVLARVLGEKLNLAWGQPVVVENRGGGGANIGAEFVARAAPDGYTLLLNASNHVINASLYDKLGYDPFADFAPITEIASYMLVLVVHPSVPATSLAELVALAKARPGRVTVGNAGLGTPTHLSGALFAQAAGLDLVYVPYKGAAPANADLIGGQVMAMFNNPVNALPQVRAGALRALAVTGAQRLSLMPELPTIAEQGYAGFEASTWFGLFAPAKVPRDVVARIHAEVARALQLPDVRDKLAAQGFDIFGNTPEEFAAILKSEHAKWDALIKSAGLKAD
jgi:tripartite-type tricarboxylate transporter receptor subunit TctC